MRLFKRTLQITAWRPLGNAYQSSRTPNALIIRDHKVTFSIKKTLGEDPNSCDLEIYNLSPTVRAELCTKPLMFEVSAGYDGNARLLFRGDLRDGFSHHDGTAWVTTIRLGDGDRAFMHARVNRSYRKGTNVRTALRDAAATMGYQLPSTVEISPELAAPFSAGVSLSGSSRTELTRLLAPYGYSWSIQNGALQILRDSEVRENAAYVLSEANGLEGSPAWSVADKPGSPAKLSITMRLYPEVQPGGRANVVSKTANGMFKVSEVNHAGDTEGGDWSTTLEATPL